MPVFASSSIARARAASGCRPSCSSSTSPIWLPTVYSGFSAVIGSWKIIAISAPRISRICCSLFCIRSAPSKRITPLRRRRVDQAQDRQRTDRLARARLADERELLARARPQTRRRRRRVASPKLTVRCSNRSNAPRVRLRVAHDFLVSNASRSASPMNVSSNSVITQQRKRRKDDPPRVEVRLALAHQVAERRHRRRHAEPEEVERSQREDRRAHAKRQERDDRRHRVRQHVAPDDLPVRQPHRARRLHEFERAVAQELGAHVVRQPDPAEQRQQDQQQQQRRLEDRREDDQQVQLGDRAPDLDEPLHRRGRRARRSSPAPHPAVMPIVSADEREREREQMLTRKPYSSRATMSLPDARRCRASSCALGGDRVRLLLEVVGRLRRMRVDRVQRPVARLRELLGDERVLPVGGRAEVAAEPCLRRVVEHREEPLAVVARDERPVVAEQLGERADHEHRGEDPQRHSSRARLRLKRSQARWFGDSVRRRAGDRRHRAGRRGQCSGGRRSLIAITSPPLANCTRGRRRRTAGRRSASRQARSA